MPVRTPPASQPYTLAGALDGATPLLLTSPHSGTSLPPGFLSGSRLGEPQLRRIEDAHVGALLSRSAALGIPLMEARYSRAVIDLNRAEDELDPAMFTGSVTARPRLTDRVRLGYGLFPRIVGPNQLIHAAKLPSAIAHERIMMIHRPWHAAIDSGLQAAAARHGYAVLLDVHSMPTLEGPAPARLVLGDLHGRSSAASLVTWLEAAFGAEGLPVVRNLPYAGGHTTERHARPGAGIHCVQLEFDRSIYMDMGSLKPHDGFAALADMLARTISALLEALPRLGLAVNLPLAAE